jgi:hypothetical protein
MTLLILIIIAIAITVYFWDDFKTWEEKIKKFWKEIPVLFDRNIKTKSKADVSKEDVRKVQQQMQDQLNEAKRGFQEILNSRKPQGYGKEMSLQEKLAKVQQQIDTRRTSKPKSIKGQKITDWERKYLWDGISKRKRVPCIHCEAEDMYKGPNDGLSQTWRCPHCGQGIKLSFYANTLAGFQCENLGINQDWIK